MTDEHEAERVRMAVLRGIDEFAAAFDKLGDMTSNQSMHRFRSRPRLSRRQARSLQALARGRAIADTAMFLVLALLAAFCVASFISSA